MTPTDRWIAAAPGLPPIAGAAGVAERLLLLIHYGIDWKTSWVAARRATYWDSILPDRIQAATFMAPNLRRWWSEVATELGSSPRSRDERDELETLLRADSRPVLQSLRWETEALLLRTRIVADNVRAARPVTNEVSA